MTDYSQEFVAQLVQGVPLQDALQRSIANEAKLRRLFATDRSNEALSNDFAGLIDVFGAHEAIRRTQARDIRDPAKLDEHYVFPLKEGQRHSTGQPAIVPDIDQFRTTWSIFSEGSLSQLIDWSNVVVAGGSVLACLLPLPEHAQGSKRAIRKHFHEVAYSSSDIDMFIYGLTPEQAEKKAIQIYEAVRDSVPWDTICVRTKHAISIHSQYPYRPVQIILRLYKSPAEILAGFDIDCACFLYNGDRVWANPRAIAAVVSQANTVDITRRSPSYEVRLAKYAMRGFEVHVPNLVRKDIDPTIFERSINRIEGLARLLVLEKLADPVDRTKYLERRREIRGRPQTHGYSRRAMRRRRKLVKGDFKAVDQLFGGLSASDYGTQSFHIPYGPGFDAKKLERVIYKMDLGMNSTFNPKNQGRRLHRHPAFFGTMDEVLEDCCEYCPDPQTLEEHDLQIEEDKVYIRGRVEFMQEDPGRQMMTGSFNPIDQGEWSMQAYLGEVEKLFHAISEDDFETVRDIVENGFDLRRRDHVGRTPLHLALMARSLQVADYLIESGARITSRLVDGRTALHLASQLGFADIVSKLLERSKQNELKAKQEKALADEKTKGDVDTSDKSENEDDDNARASSEDDWSSDEDTKKKQKPVAVKPVEDSPVEDAEIPEDSDELPDILDVNAVDWDHSLSPLCHAIVAGHLQVVEILLRNGADAQTPFKLGQYNPSTIYPLTLTLLTEDEASACSIAERLLENGASVTAADPSFKTIFHQMVLKRSMALVRTFLRVDPNAKTAMDFFQFVSWGPAFTPLVSAAGIGDHAITALLIAYGSKIMITEEMFEKSWDARQKMQSSNSYWASHKQPGQWLRDSAMPVDAALGRASDLAILLIQLGAEVNFASRDDYRSLYVSSRAIRETILDKIRQSIQNVEANIQVYRRMNAGVDETCSPETSLTTTSRIPENSFLEWFKDQQQKRICPKTDQCCLPTMPTMPTMPPTAEVASKKLDLTVPLTALEKISRAHLSWLREVEQALVSRGAKTAKELNPLLEEAQVPPLSQKDSSPFGVNAFAQRLTPLLGTPSGPHSIAPPALVTRPPSVPSVLYKIYRGENHYNTEPVATYLVDQYAALFDACWKGDVRTIERLCLPPKSGKRSKDAMYLQISAEVVPASNPRQRYGFDGAGLTTLAVAIMAKQWEAAEAILAIVQAQYEQPKGIKPRYQPFVPDSDEEDSDLDTSVDDSDIESSKPVALDLASRFSTVKVPISAYFFFSESTLYDDNGKRTRSPILQAIWDSDLKALKHCLELGQLCEPPHVLNSSCIATILQKDDPEMLDYVIRKHGYGLPEAEEDEEQEQEPQRNTGDGLTKKKPLKQYLGLNIHGRKRKELARSADPDAPSSRTTSSLPLLWQAAQRNARNCLTWLRSSAALDAYNAHMFSSNDEEAAAMRQIPEFNKKLPQLLGATPTEQGENIMLACLSSESPNVEMISHVFKLFPELKTTFVHNKIKGLGITCLWYVCAANLKPEIFDLFVARGSDPLVTDSKGRNIFHILAQKGHLNLMKHVFIKLSHDQLAMLLSQQTKGQQNTPLMLAVRSSRINVVDFLLSFDHPVTTATLTTRDSDGCLPIHLSTSTGNKKIVQSLIESVPVGMRTLFIEDGIGSTPLEMASLRYLLQYILKRLQNKDVVPLPFSPFARITDGVDYSNLTKANNYACLKKALNGYPDINKVDMEEVQKLDSLIQSLDQEGRLWNQPEIRAALKAHVERTKLAAEMWKEIEAAKDEFKKLDKEMMLAQNKTTPVPQQDPGSVTDSIDVDGTYFVVRDAIRAAGVRRRELVRLLDAQKAVKSSLAHATNRASPFSSRCFGCAVTYDFQYDMFKPKAVGKDDGERGTAEPAEYRYLLNLRATE